MGRGTCPVQGGDKRCLDLSPLLGQRLRSYYLALIGASVTVLAGTGLQNAPSAGNQKTVPIKVTKREYDNKNVSVEPLHPRYRK